MTMVLAYVWHDKIVMMADSRRSGYDSEGKPDVVDDCVKIHPAEQLIIGTSGRAQAQFGEKIFKAPEVVEHFFKDNKDRLSFDNGQAIIERLVRLWNLTLLNLGQELGKHVACFMLCKWENGNEPRVYSCRTNSGQSDVSPHGGIIGDDEAIAIARPLVKLDEELMNMTLEETINYYTGVFAAVSARVKTVGGPVVVYVLGQHPTDTGWRTQG